MKGFFQTQKKMKKIKHIFTLTVLTLFLGFTLSCDDSEDDKKTSSSKGAKSLTFSGGEDAGNEDIAEGVFIDTTAGSGGVASAVGDLEDEKLPNVDDASGSATSAGKICSYTLEGTGLPTLTPLEDESNIGVTDTNGGHSGVAAVHFVEALGDSVTYPFQGYEFTVALEGNSR